MVSKSLLLWLQNVIYAMRLYGLLKYDALQTGSSNQKKMVQSCHIKNLLFSHIKKY